MNIGCGPRTRKSCVGLVGWHGIGASQECAESTCVRSCRLSISRESLLGLLDTGCMSLEAIRRRM